MKNKYHFYVDGEPIASYQEAEDDFDGAYNTYVFLCREFPKSKITVKDSNAYEVNPLTI